jgi:hypothetical protein
MTPTQASSPNVSFKAPGKGWRALSASDKTDERMVRAAELAGADLQSSLLSSLQMQHLVVLAGSGCSLEIGGPSMGALWTAAVGDEPTTSAVQVAERVFYDLDSEESPNIESFLSHIEIHLQIHTDQMVQDFLNDCKSEILDKCRGFFSPHDLGAHKTLLHRLARRRVRDHRLKLFTTNYDLCFEGAASQLGGVALDGLSFTAPRRYDPRYYSYDIIRRPRTSSDRGSYLEGVFLLYKLHGSVNWARMPDGTIQEVHKPQPGQACLIYPASGKYQQSFIQPHLESLSQYLSALREPNTCVIVIGFGFNDDHLSAPLLDAIQSNPHLRLIVVDPQLLQQHRASSTGRHWDVLFDHNEKSGDVWFINAGFSAFSTLLPDLRALTPADKLMYAVQGAARGQ